jgi:hypothetical protein
MTVVVVDSAGNARSLRAGWACLWCGGWYEPHEAFVDPGEGAQCWCGGPMVERSVWARVDGARWPDYYPRRRPDRVKGS